MENVTCEAEEAASNQHMKTLYGLTKILCNEKPKQSTAVLDKNGNLLNKKEEKYRHDGQSTLKKYSIGTNQKTQS